jgi:hypothetical protein
VLQRIGRWLFRGSLFLLAAIAATFVCDALAFKLEGSPQSTVTVNRTMVVPLKNNKQEYDYLGTYDEPCSVSLFPQGGMAPCWWLRRNTNQNVKL